LLKMLRAHLPDNLLGREFWITSPDFMDAKPRGGLAVKTPLRPPTGQATSGSGSATVAQERSSAPDKQRVFRFQARDNLPRGEFGMPTPNGVNSRLKHLERHACRPIP
jgi:hypothetical protein